MGAPLVQIEDCQKLLSGQKPSTDWTNGAQLLIAAVSDMARTYCSREFWITSYAENYKGRNNQALYVKQRPIQSVTLLSVNNRQVSPVGVDSNGAPITSCGAIGFFFDDKGIYLTGGCTFTDSDIPNIYVNYSAGYALFAPTPIYTSLPQDLYEAICKEVAFRYREISRLGIKSQAMEGATTTFNTGPLDPAVKGVFDKYKRTWGVYA